MLFELLPVELGDNFTRLIAAEPQHGSINKRLAVVLVIGKALRI
jgi:hypothetical protein